MGFTVKPVYVVQQCGFHDRLSHRSEPYKGLCKILNPESGTGFSITDPNLSSDFVSYHLCLYVLANKRNHARKTKLTSQ